MKRNSAHTQVQRAGKVRDGYVCQVCGKTDCSEGHHIIDYSFGGAANENNIITLCHTCHQDAHNGKIDLFVF